MIARTMGEGLLLSDAASGDAVTDRYQTLRQEASLVAQMVKNLPAMQETQGPMKKGMATHSSILAWRIQWKEEIGGGLQSIDHKELDMTQRHTHTDTHTHTHTHTQNGSWGTEKCSNLFLLPPCNFLLESLISKTQMKVNCQRSLQNALSRGQPSGKNGHRGGQVRKWIWSEDKWKIIWEAS